MINPLLTDNPLPTFSAIQPQDVEPAIREMLDLNRRELSALLDSGASGWEGLVEPIERMHHRLARAWSPIGHLNGVMNNDDLRSAYEACLPLLSAYHTELAQNERLCAAYQRVLDENGADLRADQRQLLDQALRDFRLAGVSLPPEQKQRFREVMERLATIQSTFDNNVLDATNAWEKHVEDESALAGLPAATRQRALADAKSANRGGWLLRLDVPTYQAVMTHAEDEPLRREFYEAWVTRASDQGPHAGRWDNSGLIGEILALRQEVAKLTGFDNFAQHSLATKMARDPDEVLQFLHRLAHVSRTAALAEFEQLETLAGRKLQAWDIGYYSEKLKHRQLDVSEESLRPYFPLPRVLAGLFALTTRLYGVRAIARTDVDLYHPDVRYFDLVDEDGTPRAGFYLDLYARPNKRGGAWMDECVGRIGLPGTQALPVAYLVCNFMPPAGDQPSLLTHYEVLTLFHEFGHGLHHMLTRIDYPSISGIHGVPWDAVELPSQFMENFAWREEVIPMISAHVDTGEPLPVDTLRRLQATRTFLAGMQTARQLEFALFDLRLHSEYSKGSDTSPETILAEVRKEVAVVEPPAFNRFAHSFQHIFSGGYAAGYYSYKWAEVLSADAFGAFEEHGVLDPDTAQRFRREILERGGSREAMDAFVEFRGREPDIEPLLRQMGLAAQAGQPA